MDRRVKVLVNDPEGTGYRCNDIATYLETTESGESILVRRDSRPDELAMYLSITDEGRTWEWLDKPDIVNSPSHYLANGVETIDVIAAWLGPEQFKGYCRGNSVKYLSRSLRKGDELNDLKKCEWYVRRLIDTLEAEHEG